MLQPLWIAALLSKALAGMPPDAALIEATASMLGPWVGYLLIRLQPGFDKDQPTVAACGHLLLLACGGGAGSGALFAAMCNFATGLGLGDRWVADALELWMRTALGMVLVLPFLLAFRRALRSGEPVLRLGEGILVWGASMACAYLVFARANPPEAQPIIHAYWMFLFVNWSGARLGLLSTTALLNAISLVALWGSQHQRGFFAGDLTATHGFGLWAFMMILSMAGLMLAAYLAERRRQRAALRVAAIAFECHEGLLITDDRGRILQANQSMLNLSGYELAEVLGRTPDFLSAYPGSHGSTDENSRFIAPGYFQARRMLARKDGRTFPAWITTSPVDASGPRTSNYVITLSDFSGIEQRERLRREREQAHRRALVQEVHHRIKNNLQGVMGMLRELDEQHPTLHEPIDRMIDHLKSIAIIHGLQGRAQEDEVRLCELTLAIAAGIEQSWSTPIRVEIPPGWAPWRINASHSVSVALVLNELVVNAVKHGGRAHRDVLVEFFRPADGDGVVITISNPGNWPSPIAAGEDLGGMGWGLVLSLVPRFGIEFDRSQQCGRAVLTIRLSQPLVHAEGSSDHAH